MEPLAQKMRFSGDPSTADMALTQFLWYLANTDDPAGTAYLESNATELEQTLNVASEDARNAFLDARRSKEESED